MDDLKTREDKFSKEFPDDWKISSIKKALTIENNKRKPINKETRKLMQGDFPYYGPTKIQDYINEYQYDGEYALIAEDGDHFLKYKDQAMTQLAFGKLNVNNHAHVIKGTKECSTKWFYWFFNRRNIYSHLTRQGAGRYKLNKASLEQLKIAYPPIKEQSRIIHIIDLWDKNIKTLQTLIDQKQLQKKWLMQQLLTGKKRLPGFEGEWEEHKLIDYFKERKETKCVDLPLLSVGEAGVYPQTNSNKKDTSNSDKSKYKRICKGDIGYNTMRMWQGRSALSSLEGIISPAYTVVTPREHADGQFFAYLFKTPELVNKFYRNSQGLVSDTLNCKFKDFAIVKTTLPPTLKEQKAIAQVLTKADQEIKLLEQKLLELKEQKKGLMQQLLTGKKRLV